MRDSIVSVFDGSTFAVSDICGDMVRSDQSHGFFVGDTRHLSVWRLYFEGRPLDILSLADVDYYLAQFFLVPPRRALFASPEVSIIRRRIVHGNWLEEISVVNHRNDPLLAELRLEIDADFADLFEVKAGRIRERPVVRRVEGDELSLRYRSADFMRETRISTDADATVSEDGFEVTLELNPREETTLCFQVAPVGAPVRSGPIGTPPSDGRPAFDRTRTALHDELDRWMGSAPRLETDWAVLASVYRRSLADLAALRFYPRRAPGRKPAGGGAALVHDRLRSRQPDHQLSGAPLRPRAGAGDAALPGRPPGDCRGSIPRRRAGEDPARDPVRRTHRER
jgi:hypothetical protein